jgi:magnesium transporter
LHFEVPLFSTAAVDDYLSVICVPRLLVTIRTSQIPEVDRLSQDDNQQVQLIKGSKSAMLYAILDSLTDRLVKAATQSRDEIRRMSHLMDVQPDGVEVEEILAVKRTVQDITTVAEDQLYCSSALMPVDTAAFPISHQQRDYFRDASRTYEAALRVLHRYEARAAELNQQYLSSLQAKTELRLRVLTILLTICMPLTLIAGIYGMNFARMSETQWPWGYPVTLTVMFTIAVGQLVFFYKRGWLG